MPMRKEPTVRSGWVWRASVRVALSLLCAGFFHAGWLVVFLLTIEVDHSLVQALRWLLAPVVTATGFATGIVIWERFTRASRAGFLRVLPWPLIGCALGAGAVYWVGPMLIGFGIFAAGTASVVIREVYYQRQTAVSSKKG